MFALALLPALLDDLRSAGSGHDVIAAAAAQDLLHVHHAHELGWDAEDCHHARERVLVEPAADTHDVTAR